LGIKEDKMGKLKAGRCIFCQKPLLRHDKKRISIEVSDKVSKEAHLSCYQEREK